VQDAKDHSKKWTIDKITVNDDHKFEKQEFSFWTIKDYAAAYRQKRTTPLEVAKNFLSKVKELDSTEVKKAFEV
jgi:hypothetical protein